MLRLSKQNLINLGEKDSSAEEELQHSHSIPASHIDGTRPAKDVNVDEDQIDEALATLFLEKKASALDKKILFATLSREPDKYLEI